MKRSLVILALLVLGTQVFFVPADEITSAIPDSLRNNEYYTESMRLNNLARLAFSEGDYDASTQYSQEAMRYALLSDEYVSMRLKMMECDNAITTARSRLEYAASINATTRFPSEYNRAQTTYDEARSFRAAERWDDAINAANRVLTILASVDGASTGTTASTGTSTGTGTGTTTTTSTVTTTTTTGTSTTGTGTVPLPAQYTVRPWEAVKDCLWNIASRPWVYNDAQQWRRLYDANKSKMPEPDNPDLIKPGMVLDIPSIRGEVRQGMWNSNQTYPPLP